MAKKEKSMFPETVGRLQLLKVIKPADEHYDRYKFWRAIYVDEPNYKLLDVAECLPKPRHDCKCEKAARRCITDREDFWIPMPYTYYVFNAYPAYGGSTRLQLYRMVWSLQDETNRDQPMIWVPLLNCGHNTYLCSPAAKPWDSKKGITEDNINEVFSMVWGSMWNGDYGYYTSAFSHWLINEQIDYEAYDFDVNTFMMKMHTAWQKLDIDGLLAAPHNSMGFSIKQFMENPSISPVMPKASPIVYIDRDDVLQSVRDKAKLPRRLRWN